MVSLVLDLHLHFLICFRLLLPVPRRLVRGGSSARRVTVVVLRGAHLALDRKLVLLLLHLLIGRWSLMIIGCTRRSRRDDHHHVLKIAGLGGGGGGVAALEIGASGGHLFLRESRRHVLGARGQRRAISC